MEYCLVPPPKAASRVNAQGGSQRDVAMDRSGRPQAYAARCRAVKLAPFPRHSPTIPPPFVDSPNPAT